MLPFRLARYRGYGGRIIEHEPLDNRQRQASVADQLIVKRTQAKSGSLPVAIAPQQAHDLPLPHHVPDLLRRLRRGSGCLAFRGLAIESSSLHEVPDRLLEAPASGLQVHIHSDPGGTIPAQPQHLSLRGRLIGIQSLPHQHLLPVEGPSLDKGVISMLPTNLVGKMIGDGELKEMAGDAFVTQDGARILDSGANVEVGALGIVKRDEIEAVRILVVNARWVHEPSRAGGLEGLRQLSNEESSDIGRDGDQSP